MTARFHHRSRPNLPMAEAERVTTRNAVCVLVLAG
jgi:hypothetical protein